MNDYLMIPLKSVKYDLVTENENVIYVPKASENDFGVVKIGEGLNIDEGVLSLDKTEIHINTISKNGTIIEPDSNKNVDITLYEYIKHLTAEQMNYYKINGGLKNGEIVAATDNGYGYVGGKFYEFEVLDDGIYNWDVLPINAGSKIIVGDDFVETLEFDSDPQTQIDNINVVVKNYPLFTKNNEVDTIEDIKNSGIFTVKNELGGVDFIEHGPYSVFAQFYDENNADYLIIDSVSTVWFRKKVDGEFEDVYYRSGLIYRINTLQYDFNPEIGLDVSDRLGRYSVAPTTTHDKLFIVWENTIEDKQYVVLAHPIEIFAITGALRIHIDYVFSEIESVGSQIESSINSSNYVMTLNLKNAFGDVISTTSVDLPLETMVVSGYYDDATKEVVLTLQSGSTIRFSVADLVDGLASQTDVDSRAKLDASNLSDENVLSWRDKLRVVGQKYGNSTGGEIFNNYVSNTASGKYSHAEGNGTKATGQNSHAEGWVSVSSGQFSHAEGWNSAAMGQSSHAEGQSTQASGMCSHAEGFNTYAQGNYAHSEGKSTQAKGNCSHAGGLNTIAGYDYQTVIGMFNENKQANIFEIGYGATSNDRMNVFEVSTDGIAYAGGKQLATTEDIENASGDFVTLNTEQTITADKTTTNSIIFQNPNSNDYIKLNNSSGNLGFFEKPNETTDEFEFFRINSSGTQGVMLWTTLGKIILNVQNNQNGVYDFNVGNFSPGVDNARDLGTTSTRYKDLYLSGNLSDGTNSISIADIPTTIETTVNPTNYVMTTNLKNASGTIISTGTVDLPLESVVVSGSYDDVSKEVVLTLQNGSTVEFSIGDLVDGLANQSDVDNRAKLDASNLSDDNILSWQNKLNISGVGQKYFVDGVGKGEIFNNYVSNTASGEYSHAEGQDNNANGYCSHCEGRENTANTDSAHAEGGYNLAGGAYSHAEGTHTHTNGIAAHAEGYYTEAFGAYSHAGGEYTKTAYQSQTAIGKYNNNKSTNLFEVGNGTSKTARSNAFEVSQDGNAYASGKILATQEYVDNSLDTIGTPTVSVGTTITGEAGTNASVTNTGTDTAAVFNFTIPKGDSGKDALTCSEFVSMNTDPAIKNFDLSYFNRTPEVDDDFLVVWENNATGIVYICNYYVYSVGESSALCYISTSHIISGTDGTDGVSITGATAGTASTSGNTTTTPITFSFSDDTTQTVNVSAQKGDTGATGPANTLSIGTVTTGAAGTNASATITGTAPNQVLNLTIPRGADGQDGTDASGGEAVVLNVDGDLDKEQNLTVGFTQEQVNILLNSNKNYIIINGYTSGNENTAISTEVSVEMRRTQSMSVNTGSDHATVYVYKGTFRSASTSYYYDISTIIAPHSSDAYITTLVITPTTPKQIVVDSGLSVTSSNPVQNSVVTKAINSIGKTIFPVGSIYISTINTSPASFIGGSWSKINNNYYLKTASQIHWDLGTSGIYDTTSALPNISGTFIAAGYESSTATGAFSKSNTSNCTLATSGGSRIQTITFNASNSNSIYGASNDVEPKSYSVFMWRRTE